MKNNNYDLVMCCNVLNVIAENEVIEGIMTDIKNHVVNGAVIVFQIYEGNKSGEGRPTKNDCYQRNEATKNYIQFINKYFNVVKIAGNIIQAVA